MSSFHQRPSSILQIVVMPLLSAMARVSIWEGNFTVVQIWETVTSLLLEAGTIGVNLILWRYYKVFNE